MDRENLTLESFGYKDYTNLSDSQISNAVGYFLKTLRIDSGTSNTFDLYLLMRTYLKNTESRLAINKILQTANNEKENIKYGQRQNTMVFYMDLLRRFISEFENDFLQEELGDQITSDKKEKLKGYLERLKSIPVMMKNDLLK